MVQTERSSLLFNKYVRMQASVIGKASHSNCSLILLFKCYRLSKFKFTYKISRCEPSALHPCKVPFPV